MAVSVGIDLGTTFSSVAIIDKQTNLPKIVPNREGGKITPSVIQFINGKPVFGSEAESAFNAGEPNCIATFKRNMGKSEPYCYIDGKEYTAEDLSALLLNHLRESAEAELGESIKDAVITVPAYFFSTEREATLNAAKRAGIIVKRIIDEPNAAAIAYGLNNWRENANILVYDLGGGTFDVTLTRMGKDGELTTITTRGNHELGGRDWDNRIESMLIDRFADEVGIESDGDSETKLIIRGLTEGVKKQLSVMHTVKVTTSFPNHGQATVTITREEFESGTRDLIDRTGALCQAILDEAGVNKSSVTDVLLVGGSTRMPQVSAYLTDMFGKKPISHINPDEAVALGAAVQSSKEVESYTKLTAIVKDGKKVTDRSKLGISTNATVQPAKKLSGIGLMNLCETTAHAMGIIAVSPDGKYFFNDVIIPANHPRPVKFAKAFTQRTNANGDTEMEIFVLQGDNDKPLENQIPFRYVVSSIRHISKQRNKTLIRVQYSYDHNGIIHVEARQEDDNVNLPMRRDSVPVDMSIYGLPVDANSANQNAGAKGLMSNWGGVNLVPTSGYIKERVQKAGGSIEGDICCRLAWSNHDDLDFHMIEPCGNEIQFSNKGPSPSGGLLDVDMNAGESSCTRSAVENIFYGNESTMLEGLYHLFVRQYKQRESTSVGFEVECDIFGDIVSFKYDNAVRGDVTVMKFQYSRTGGITVVESLPPANTSENVANSNSEEREVETWD